MTKFKKFTQMPNKTRILGIDPGYGRMGIAVIESHKGNQNLIYSECFETTNKLEHPDRLALIATKLDKIINKYKPDKVAVEDLLFNKNVKTALKVAEARGVILAISAKRKVEICEFNPNSIKLAVTGYGRSDKKQIITMIHQIINLESKKHDDEYDAIAVAITCAVSKNLK